MYALSRFTSAARRSAGSHRCAITLGVVCWQHMAGRVVLALADQSLVEESQRVRMPLF
jgi:hypothetical protein